MTTQLVILAALVLVNAALSGSELAIVSLRDSQVARLQEASKAGARLARIAAEPTGFLATIQVGITLAGFLASASAAVSLADPAADALRPAIGDVADTIAVPVVTVVLAYFTLVFGELVPKRMAMQYAERWALLAAAPLELLSTVVRPIVWFLKVSTNLVVRLLGGDPNAAGELMSEDELRDLVAGHEGLDEEHRAILAETFDIAERTVGQVLVPRREVIALDAAHAVGQARAVLVSSGYSRAPVCHGANIDDCIGVVHLRDLLPPDDGLAADRAGPITVLPETQRVLDALTKLRAERSQFALVIDEHGGGAGVVTVEDLLEEIVGDIFDETDRDVITVTRSGDAITLPGSFPIHDLDDLGLHVPQGPYTTIAGFLLHSLGTIPTGPGDVVEHEATSWTVAAVEGHAITSVTAIPTAPPPLDDDDASAAADAAEEPGGPAD